MPVFTSCPDLCAFCAAMGFTMGVCVALGPSVGVMSFPPPFPSAMTTPLFVSVSGACRLLLPVSEIMVPVFTSRPDLCAFCAAMGFTMGVCAALGPRVGVMSFPPPLPSAMTTPLFVSVSGAFSSAFCAAGRDALCTPAFFCVCLFFLFQSSRKFMVYLPITPLMTLPALVFLQLLAFLAS